MLATTSNEKLDQAGVKLVLISCQNRHPISDMEEAARLAVCLAWVADDACHCNIATVASSIASCQGG